MGRNKSCTPDLRGRIVWKYTQQNMSIRKIALELVCSKTMFRNAIRHYAENGTIENKNRPPRPRKTTTEEDRIICRTSKKNPFLTSSEIRKEVGPQLTDEIAERTIRRRLQENELRGCIA